MASALGSLRIPALRVLHKTLGNFLHFAKFRQHFQACLE